MKSRLAVAAAAAVAIATLLTAGCSSSPAAQPASGSNSAGPGAAATIPLLTGGDVGAYSTIDPNQTESCNDNYCGLFMEHLLQPGPNSTLQPELATSWTQASPVTYVYHLRTGVKFWDGSPMTAADVVYSLDMAQSAYPHGLTATTVIDNGVYGPNDPNDIQVVAAELQKIGITLKVHEVTGNAYINAYTNPPGGDFFAQFGAVSPDPSVFPSYMLGTTPANNVANYFNPSITSLLADGLTTSNPATRLADYAQVLKQVATDVPYIALFSPDAFTALSTKYTLPQFIVFPGFFSWALHIKRAA